MKRTPSLKHRRISESVLGLSDSTIEQARGGGGGGGWGTGAGGGGAVAREWVPLAEFEGLMTRYDGEKRWFRCRQCDYRNDGLSDRCLLAGRAFC